MRLDHIKLQLELGIPVIMVEIVFFDLILLLVVDEEVLIMDHQFQENQVAAVVELDGLDLLRLGTIMVLEEFRHHLELW